MRKRLLQSTGLLSLLLVLALSSGAQTQIYYYTNATNGAYNMLAANLTATNLTTVGSWGTNTPCSTGGGISGLTTAPTFTTYNPGNAGSPALNVNITPNTGYYIQINSISVSLRRSGTGPAKARLAYSTDGGSTWIDNGSDYIPNNAGCGSFSTNTWTLATPAYVCSGMLKVRIYYYASGATSGTCQTANLRIMGAVAPITAPSVSISANPAGPVCSGTNVTFTASPVNSGSAPVYTWRLNGNITGINSSTYTSHTLTSTDIITCAMVSNAPCVPTGPVNSNGISITVLQPVAVTLHDTICAGENYTLGTQILNTSGTYTDTFTAANSCDSIVVAYLFVRPVISHTFADTICAAINYGWGSQNLTTTGIYNQTFPSYTGCDSSVTLNLFVRPAITHTFSDTVCAATTYTWGGQNLTITGTYNQIFTSYTNCDSTVTLNLFVRPAITHNINDTICAAASYTWAGQTFTTGGNYNHVFPSYTSCDSTVTLHLFVRQVINFTFADTICAGGTYNWAGQGISTGGTYNHVFASYTSCDSAVMLHLFVRPAISPIFADTACAGVTYNWAGQSLNTTGTYNHVFTSYVNCDSSVTLNLFVRPAITHAFNDTICAATSYNWGAQNLSSNGSYNQTFTSYTNCDSTVTLHLFVRPLISYTFADTVCAGITYSWAGQNLNGSGIYNHIFTSYTNCDSTVILNLFVRPAINHTFNDTLCAAGTYSWGSQSLNASGTYNQTFTSFTSCDSTVTLQLFVRPAISHSFADTICTGNTYNWAGQGFTTSGTYNHIFTSYTGCDSTVILNLFVRPVQNTTDTRYTCFGVPYSFAGQLLTTTGVYTHTFPDIHGCDSTVTLTLHVDAAINNTITAAICSGTVYNWGTQTHTTAGTFNQAFTAANGCDSLVTLQLTVNPAHTDTLTISICNNATYTLGSQTLNQSGTYTEAFTTVSGCDSTITLHLTVNPPAVTKVIDTAACGEVWFEGIAYTAVVTLTDTFITALGCDSLYRTVHINPHPAPVIKEDNISGCGSVVFEGNTYNQSTTLQDTLFSQYGCDSMIRTTHIKVNGKETQTIVHEMCTGDKFIFNGQQYTAAGSYPFLFKTHAGCDSLVTLQVKINPLPVVTVEQETIRNYCIGDSIRLQASGAETYMWQYNDTTQEPENYFEAKLYRDKNYFSVAGTDVNGCRSSTDIQIEAQPCCNIWMPNAFSPNADGLNDVFKPESQGHPGEYVLHIFNRWGETVFSSFNINKGWDGSINGKPAEIADYYYRISGKCVNGEPINLKGTCTLIR
jgi:gliding motility-associated-like protein